MPEPSAEGRGRIKVQEERVSHAGLSVGVALLLAASAEVPAAEPLAPEAKAEKPAPAATPQAANTAAATRPTRAPLNLQVGDIRKYMMPNEYRAAINGPDSDNADIVVQGERPAPPLKSMQPIPGGIATPFWMLAHPLKAWRALLPDPNAPPPGPPNVVPEREFRWGP